MESNLQETSIVEALWKMYNAKDLMNNTNVAIY